MQIYKRLLKRWDTMLETVLPWAEKNPKLFLASLVFWVLLPVSLGMGAYFLMQALLVSP